MKLVFISLFPLLFVVGVIVEPIPFDTLSAATIGLLVVTALLDRIGMRFARRNRVGVETEQFGTVELVTFLNNPWARNWPNFRRLMALILASQIISIAAVTLWLGETVRHIISESPP